MKHQQVRVSNASSINDRRNFNELAFTDVLQNGRRVGRGSSIENYRRGGGKRRAITQTRAKTFHRRMAGPDFSYTSGRQGEGSPQNIKIMRPIEQNGTGEPITTYEVAGTSMTDNALVFGASKETSSDLRGLGSQGTAFIRTSTLTRQPTGTNVIKEMEFGASRATTEMLANVVDSAYESHPHESLQNSTIDGPAHAVLPSTVRQSTIISQDGNAANTYQFPTLQLPQAEMVKMTQSSDTVGLTDFAIVEQNNDSCLELDVKQMDEQSTAAGANANLIKHIDAAQALYPQDSFQVQQMQQQQQDLFLQQQAEQRQRSVSNNAAMQAKRVVGVTNIDFREAKQYRRQRSGVENPQHKVTYKLPSYASCLRAQIRPKNYAALRQYYELLVKDEKLAKINEKYFLQNILKEDAPCFLQANKTPQQRGSPKVRNERKASSAMEISKNRQYESKKDSPLRIVQEGTRSSGKGSQADSQKRHQTSPARQTSAGSIKLGHQTVSRLSDGNRLISVRPRKYQIAFNGPGAKDIDNSKDPSLQTFVDEPEGRRSRYGLSNLGENTHKQQNEHHHTILQDEGKRAYSNNNLNFGAKDGHRTCFTLSSSLKANHIHKSQNPSALKRFGLTKVTDQTINLSSQLLVGSQKSKKLQADQILEPVLQVRGSTGDPSKLRSKLQNRSLTKASGDQDNEKNSMDSTIENIVHTRLITANESEVNMTLAQPTPQANNSISKKRVKTTHDVTKAEGLPYEHYQHSSARRKRKVANAINEDLMLLRDRQSSQNAESQEHSDKGIDIAMRTNDIFSSRHDEDEMIDLQVVQHSHNNLVNDNMTNTLHCFHTHAGSAPIGEQLAQDHLRNETHVVTQRLHQNIESSQSGTATQGLQEISQFPGGPVQQIFTSQGFSTVRNMNSVGRTPQRLQSMHNITQVEIVREAQNGLQGQKLAVGQCNSPTKINGGATVSSNMAPLSNIEASKRSSTEGGSEVRRHQMKYQNFRRVHNRMMLQSPGLHVVPSLKNKNEAQTQVQIVLTPVEGSARKTRNNELDPETVMLASKEKLPNNIDKQQFSSSHLEGVSVYHNSHTKILHHQHSNRININESEMLNLLDMYFGPSSNQQTTRAGVSPNTLTMVALGGTQHYVQQLQTKQLQLPTVRSRATSQMHPQGLYGNMRSSANRAALQNQRRSMMNRKNMKGKRGTSTCGQTSALYKSKNVAMRNSTVVQATATSSIIPKNLLQGKNGKETQAASMATEHHRGRSAINNDKMGSSNSLEVSSGFDAPNFFLVKQLKPTKQHHQLETSIITSKNCNDKRLTNKQGQEKVQGNQASQGGIKVNNPTSVYLMQKHEMTQPSLESLQKCSINSGQYDPSPMLKPQLQGKIDQVVIPTVPASASQLNLRKELRGCYDSTAREENNFVMAMAQSQNDTVPISIASNDNNVPNFGMIQKFSSDHRSKHQTRAANLSMQNSQDRTKNKKSDSDHTYSTILKYDSPKATGIASKQIKLDPGSTCAKIRESGIIDVKLIQSTENLTELNGDEIIDQTQTEYNDAEKKSMMKAFPQGQLVLTSQPSSVDQEQISKNSVTPAASIQSAALNAMMIHNSAGDARMASEYADNTQKVELDEKYTPVRTRHSQPDAMSDASILIGKTPEFLKILNVGQAALDDLLPVQVSYATSKDASNKDIKAIMVVPNIGQQIRDASGALTLDPAMTLQTETRHSEGIHGGSHQQEEYGAVDSGKPPIGSLSSSAKYLNQPVNVCDDQKNAHVSINSRESPRSSVGLTIGGAGIYHQNAMYGESKASISGNQKSQKINFKDCAMGVQEQHAANMLQAYWPYLSGGLNTAEVTGAPATADPNVQQRRPMTQQGTGSQHVPLKQFPVAKCVPYQQHQRLASRKRTNSQVKIWKSGVNTRMGKTMTSLNAMMTPSQPETCIQGKRFSQTGQITNPTKCKESDPGIHVVPAALTNKQTRLKSTIAAVEDVTTRQASPSQQKMIVVGSPGRNTVNDQSNGFVLPPNLDLISQEGQLIAIQSVLRSGLDTNHGGSRVLGIVGDFVTLHQHQNTQDVSRNEAIKTMSLNNEEVEADDGEVLTHIHTFGDSNRQNRHSETESKNPPQQHETMMTSHNRHASALLKQFTDEDPMTVAEQNIQSQACDLATGYQHSAESRHNSEQKKFIEMDVKLFEKHNQRHHASSGGAEEMSPVSGGKPLGEHRNSSTEHHTFYDSTDRQPQQDKQVNTHTSPSAHVRHTSQPMKQKTNANTTRFDWQVKENQGQIGSSILNGKRSSLGATKTTEESFNDKTISILEKQTQRSEGRSKPHRGAEAYMSYAMRTSSREGQFKERLGHRYLVTQEQGTITSAKKNSEIDHPSTLHDSLAINSEVMKESATHLNRHSAPKIIDQQLDASNASIKSSHVQLAKSSSMESTNTNPYKVKVRGPFQDLTSEVLEQRSKLQAAQKVQQVIENINYHLQDNDRDPIAVQRTAAQKELAANISNIYSYQARRPFNITTLQVKAGKQSNIQGYQERQHQKLAEKQFLQRQMGESFYSSHQKGKMNSFHQYGHDLYGNGGGSPGKCAHPGRRRDMKSFQVSHPHSIDSANSSYNDHFLVPTAANAVKHKQNSSMMSGGSEGSDQSSLMIRGQIPSKIQHQSYLLNSSVDQFIAVQDQNQKGGAASVEKKLALHHHHGGSPYTVQSSNHDLSRVAIKLVQAQTAHDMHGESVLHSMLSNEERQVVNVAGSSLQSTLIMNQNQKVLHTSVQPHRNGIMQAHVVTTEFSAGKQSSSNRCHSPVFNNGEDKIAMAVINSGEHHVMHVQKMSIGSSLEDNQGSSTIRPEENKMNFDQVEWRRISTSMKLQDGDETSSCRQPDAAGEVQQLDIGNSMRNMGLHVRSIVESKRSNTISLADPDVSQITLNIQNDGTSQQQTDQQEKSEEVGQDQAPKEEAEHC